MFNALKKLFIRKSEKGNFWFFVGFFLLAIFYITITMRIDKALADLIEKNEKLSREMRLLESQVIKSKEVKEKLYQLERIIENYRSCLPKPEDVNNIAILLGGSAKNSDLELEKLTFKREGGKTYIFNLKLSGSFFSFIDFLDKVWASPFLMGVRSFNLSVSQDGSALKIDIDFVVLER